MRETRTLPLLPLLLLGAYVLVMLVVAAVMVPSGRSDDLEALLFGQSFAWGYQAKNPPGFFWLVHLAGLASGPSLPLVYGLRFAALFAAVAGLYALARRLQPDPMLAVCAGFAVLTTLHFHWYLLFHLTNTMLALAVAPLAVLALLQVGARGTAGDFARLGLALGAGMLARYNFAVLAVALLLAALVAPEWRRALLRPRLAITGAVAAALVLPHALWVAQHLLVLAAQIEAQVIDDPALPWAVRVARGLGELAGSTASILALPFGALALACFPQAFRPARVADPVRASELALVGRTVAIALGLMLAYVLAGTDYVKPHHLFFLVLVPVWLIARLDPGAVWRRAAPVFAGGIAICAVAAAVAFPVTLRRDAARCDACAEYQPVDRYAAALRAAGFAGGTVLALSRRQAFPTAALLVHLPATRVIDRDAPLYAPPPGTRGADCAIVWSAAQDWPAGWGPGEPVPGIGLAAPAGAPIGTVTGRVALSGRPTAGMRFLLVKGGLGECR